MAVTLAVVSVVLVLVAPAAGGDLQAPVTLALVLASTLPLAFRRRWPVPVALVMGLVVLAGSAAGANLALGGLGLLVAVYTVATCSARRTSLLVLVSIPAFLLLADLLYALARPSPIGALAAGFAANVTVFVLVWAAGDAVRVAAAIRRHPRGADPPPRGREGGADP